MKNTNKIVSIIVLIAVLVATVAGAYLGLAGRATQMVTVNVDGVETERALYRQVAFIPNPVNDTWQEAIVPSAQLGGGVEYVFGAVQGDMTDAEFAKAVKSAAKIAGKRAAMIAGDSNVTVDGATISVVVPSDDYDSLLASIVSPIGEVTFCLYDAATGLFGEPLMTGEHVKDAGYYTNNNAYYLQMQLNKKGQKALASIAKENAGNTLYVLQDGSYLGYFYLSEGMDTQYVSFTTDDWSYALGAAVCLRAGKLPVSLTLENSMPAEGTHTALLNIVITAMFIITALAAVYMIIRGKLAGLTAVLTLAAQGVVYCLIMALTAVSADWKLTITALILLAACQLLFIAGLILVNDKIAALNKHRALKPALNQAMKTSLKPLATVYGALVVLGLAMMILFSAQPAAILGRLVALSGVISFVAIFVVLRVLVSCVVTLKKSK